jgi:hypothetical protein
MRPALALLAGTLLAGGMLWQLVRSTDDFTLRERRTELPAPVDLWRGIVEHEWQGYLEQRLLQHLGALRTGLILLYNEFRLRAYPTRPNRDYVWTPGFGFYPVDSILRLNFDIRNRDQVERHYARAAGRLRLLQSLLERRGVSLLVVPATPKVRVYPEFVAPYLPESPERSLEDAASYGDALAAAGVNVIDSQRFLRALKAESTRRFFTATSFHWSYFGGCVVTGEIVRRAAALLARPLFPVDCGDVSIEPVRWADRDVADILNIFSRDRVAGDAPFPLIRPGSDPGRELPGIALVGDSFSDQIVYALGHAMPELAWRPDWLTSYPRLSQRQQIRIDGEPSRPAPLRRDDLPREILNKDLLLIEESDGDVYRSAEHLDDLEFGLTRRMLEDVVAAPTCGRLDPARAAEQGWRPASGDGWQTTDSRATLVMLARRPGDCDRLTVRVTSTRADPQVARQLSIAAGNQEPEPVVVAAGSTTFSVRLPDDATGEDPLLLRLALIEPTGAPLDLRLEGIEATGGGAVHADGRAPPAVPQATAPAVPAHAGIDVLEDGDRDDVEIQGLSGLESNAQARWRWGLGPRTRIKFYVGGPAGISSRPVKLRVDVKNALPIEGQRVTLLLNQRVVRTLVSDDFVSPETPLQVVATLDARRGVNILELVYRNWNHGSGEYAPQDPRKLAAAIMGLTVTLAD